MNSDLGHSAEMFGFRSAIFFIGYLLFEIPSNIILQRVDARIWIARIIVTWGIIVIIIAYASSALELAGLRFIPGIAEAGFFPGLILYLTAGFRKREMAQAVALFMAALAVSNIAGARPHPVPGSYIPSPDRCNGRVLLLYWAVLDPSGSDLHRICCSDWHRAHQFSREPGRVHRPHPDGAPDGRNRIYAGRPHSSRLMSCRCRSPCCA